MEAEERSRLDNDRRSLKVNRNDDEIDDNDKNDDRDDDDDELCRNKAAFVRSFVDNHPSSSRHRRQQQVVAVKTFKIGSRAPSIGGGAVR